MGSRGHNRAAIGPPFFVTTSAPLTILAVGKDGTPITPANYAAQLAAGNLQFAPASGDFNADGFTYDFPDVSSYDQKTDRHDYQVGNGIFTKCAGGIYTCGQFSQPKVGQQGNQKVNQFRNPGYALSNFIVKKVTRISEGVKLEFRFDTFNLFNRVNLTPVDANLQSPTFGTSLSTYPPRQMLLGAKIEF